MSLPPISHTPVSPSLRIDDHEPLEQNPWCAILAVEMKILHPVTQQPLRRFFPERHFSDRLFRIDGVEILQLGNQWELYYCDERVLELVK